MLNGTAPAWSDALIDSLYDALTAPASEQRSRLVELLCEAAPFAAVSIHGFDSVAQRPFATTSDAWDSKCVDDYVAYYHRVSPWMDTHLTSSVGEIYLAREITPDFSRTHAEFYHDWAAPAGKGAGVAMKALQSDGLAAVVSFDYALTVEREVDDALRNVVRALRPHLARVLSLSRMLERADDAAAGLRGALDASPTPTFIVDARLRVEELNAAARRLLDAAPGLSIDAARRLQLAGGDNDKRLKRFVSSAGPAQGSALDGRTTLPLWLGDAPSDVVLISAKPCPGLAGHDAFLSGAARFVVTMRSPLLSTAPERAALEAAFGLTPAEARVAQRLAQGLSIAEIAETHGVVQNTVRTQVKSIFSKTGRRRQSELVRLIQSLGAP